MALVTVLLLILFVLILICYALITGKEKMPTWLLTPFLSMWAIWLVYGLAAAIIYRKQLVKFIKDEINSKK